MAAVEGQQGSTLRQDHRVRAGQSEPSVLKPMMESQRAVLVRARACASI